MPSLGSMLCFVGVHDYEHVPGQQRLAVGLGWAYDSVCLRCAKAYYEATRLRARREAAEAKEDARHEVRQARAGRIAKMRRQAGGDQHV